MLLTFLAVGKKLVEFLTQFPFKLSSFNMQRSNNMTCFLHLLLALQAQNYHESSPTVKSLVKMCETMNYCSEFYVIKCMNISNEEFTDNFYQNLSLLKPVQIEDLKNLPVLKNRLRSCVIILIDSYESFKIFGQKISSKKFNLQGFYTILSTKNNLNSKNIEKIFQTFWKLMIYNVNIFIHDGINFDNVLILTFIPFSRGNCHNLKNVKINEFNREINQWSSADFFPKKFVNLQKCLLRVGTVESAPGLIVKTVENQTRIFGFEGEMFNEIASRLNFRMIFTVIDYPTGSVFENGSATGIFEKLVKSEFDIVMSLFSANFVRSIFLASTKSYYVDRMIIVLPSDEILDPFLKLFYAFDFVLWIILFCIFTTTVVLFWIVQTFLPSFHKNYFQEITVPFLSLLVIFVGGSERKLPKKQLTRIVFASFLIFGKVIRSVYQGALFNIIKKDIVINEIKSIDDINTLQYTFYLAKSIDAKTQDLNIFNK